MPVRCVVALWAAALLVPFAASHAPVQEAAPAISLGGQHQFARRIRNSRAARYPI